MDIPREAVALLLALAEDRRATLEVWRAAFTGSVTLAQAQHHWTRDVTASCHRARVARDRVWDEYHRRRTEPGRRHRGRQLSAANQRLHDARAACPVCSCAIVWPW